MTDMISRLPDEMVEYILEYNHLEFVDVVRCSLTCKHLYKIITNSNKLWRHKFFQRWPNLKEAYEEFGQSDSQVINWKEAVQASICGRRKLLHQISLMSSENYRKHELSDCELKSFDELFCPEKGSHPMAYYFLVDELMNLIGQPEITSNLTHRYYALKVLRYMRQSHIKLDWQKFISSPAKEQILEKGATIVAQWSQPEKNISYSHIAERLDNIAEQAKEALREENPSHSIFSAPEEQFTVWRNNILPDNQWTVAETKQAIDAMSKVLFDILGYTAILDMYGNPGNILIDHVLENHNGIPITLFIIFESVARRLGISCVFISLPTHIVLEWTARDTTLDAKYTEKYYIDIFDRGHLLTRKNCPRISEVAICPLEEYKIFQEASAAEVLKSMVDILEVSVRHHTHLNGRPARLRSTFELQHLVDPCDTCTLFKLAGFYAAYKMELTDILQILADMEKNVDVRSRIQVDRISRAVQGLEQHPLRDKDIKPKQRTPYTKYAVGLIMWNSKDHYFCVITDWDPWCDTLLWREQEVTDDIIDKEQPFYNVLLDDGSSRYVMQDDIILAPEPRWINHCEVGRHFCKFNGTYYMPNEEKARRYPDDEAVRNEMLRYVYKPRPVS